jgi:integrase
MKDLINTFLDEQLAQGRSSNTVRTYRSGLYLFARDIKKPVEALSSRDVHVWLMGLKISPWRRHNIRCALSTYFDWCRRWGYIPEEKDIMFRVGTVKRPKVMKPWLTQRQVRKVLNHGCRKALRGFLRTKTYYLIKFISLTSWRLNEALSLRWHDIDWEKGCITYKQKGGDADIYPIDADISELFREYRGYFDRWLKKAERKGCNNAKECAKHDYVFPSKRGRKWYKAYYAVRASGAAVGIKVHPHMLRHSFAQWFMDSGGGVDGLQMLMGHKDPATTQGYFHRHLKLKKRARKVIKFKL